MQGMVAVSQTRTQRRKLPPNACRARKISVRKWRNYIMAPVYKSKSSVLYKDDCFCEWSTL